MFPIHASYACPDYDRELPPGHIPECIVNEPITLTVHAPGHNAKWELVRSPEHPEPPTAAGNYNNGRLIPNIAGRFDLQCTIDGWVRTVTVAAVPREVLEHLEYPKTMAQQRRMRLRAALRDATPETVSSAFEGKKFNPSALSVLVGRPEGVPFAVRNYQ
jgi:hypothetical protein